MNFYDEDEEERLRREEEERRRQEEQGLRSTPQSPAPTGNQELSFRDEFKRNLQLADLLGEEKTMVGPLGNISYYEETKPRSREEYQALLAQANNPSQPNQQSMIPTPAQQQTPLSNVAQQQGPQNYESLSEAVKHKLNTTDKTLGTLSRHSIPLGVINAAKDMALTGMNIWDKNINDKYKHAVVSFNGGKHGVGGAGFAAALGGAKEFADIVLKSSKQMFGIKDYGGYDNILKDSAEDWQADKIGIREGQNHPNEDPEEWLKRFYSRYYR